MALVRPHLENVQIRATKLVDSLSNLSYTERLQKLNIPTLAHRRCRGAMIELYKHFNVYSRDTLADSFQPRERCTRSHDKQLHERVPKDGVRGLQSNSFYYRYARIWNSLPAHVVDAESLNPFKNALDKHWKKEPSKYDHLYDTQSDS